MVEECKDTRIHGLSESALTLLLGGRGKVGTDRFGWKAIPFALEDFDSNCPGIQQQPIIWGKPHTLVNMLGEDCMIAQRDSKP